MKDKLLESLTSGPVKQSVNSAFGALNSHIESLDLFKKYSAAQFERIRSQHQHIKLLGMTAPIPLENIYYPTAVSTTIHRRLYEQEWLSGNNTRVPKKRNEIHKSRPKATISAEEYVYDNRKVVILGGPGAGKTTFLRFMALANAKGIASAKIEKNKQLVPFFVHLPQFSKSSATIFEFISEPLKSSTTEYASSYVRRVFKNGRALLLLDSLDEVPTANRSSTLSKIKEFESCFPNARIILSCRTADYEETLESFCEVEIARLGRGAISKIVSAWFESDQEKASQLTNLISSDDGVASLTETPLLLSLLCIQYRHDLTLPRRKVELYRRCVDTLLRDWDTTRGFRRETAYENMSDDRKERLFEHVAGKFFVEHESYEFKREHLIYIVSKFIEKIDLNESHSCGLIDEIDRHHGIIERLSQDSYCFSHTSLQEYFVARHILAQRSEFDLVSKNMDNESWHPVIEFIVALAENPASILDLLIQKSNVSGLSNFPPMARRTKLLMLLYKSMISAPFVDRKTSALCYQHLVNTQLAMAKIFINGKVIPFAELGPSGVRHILLHMDRPRPTLGDALQPYRRLANQIFLSPITGYAQECFTAADELINGVASGRSKNKFIDLTLSINLLIPLGQQFPEDVVKRLNALPGESGKDSLIEKLLSNSIKYINSKQ